MSTRRDTSTYHNSFVINHVAPKHVRNASCGTVSVSQTTDTAGDGCTLEPGCTHSMAKGGRYEIAVCSPITRFLSSIRWDEPSQHGREGHSSGLSQGIS